MSRLLILAVALLALGAGVAFAQAPAGGTKPRAHRHVAGGGGGLVVLETVKGKIVIKLADADAPKTCANFRKLVGEKFYDGTYFHRVIPGFMIQGGDPNTKNADANDDGIGGPGYTVPAEIKLKHLRGSVATARSPDQVNPKRDSSGSQFFIDVGPQPSLDAGGYTVFGQVVEGMDVVDAIVKLPGLPANGGGNNPQKEALITRAYIQGAAAAKPKAAMTEKAKADSTH